MTTTSSHTAATLPDPRETDLSMEQLYMNLVQGAWQTNDGQQKQLLAINTLLQIEKENNERYKNLIAEYEQPNPNALLPGKRKELIAVLNAIYWDCP